jgi:hypothetical protein
MRSQAEPVGKSCSDDAWTRGSRRCRVTVRPSLAVVVSARQAVPKSAAIFSASAGEP